MFAKGQQIDIARQCRAPRQDMAEVRRRPQISNRSIGAIALARERRCEAIEVRATWPAAQLFRHL